MMTFIIPGGGEESGDWRVASIAGKRKVQEEGSQVERPAGESGRLGFDFASPSLDALELGQVTSTPSALDSLKLE